MWLSYKLKKYSLLPAFIGGLQQKKTKKRKSEAHLTKKVIGRKSIIIPDCHFQCFLLELQFKSKCH